MVITSDALAILRLSQKKKKKKKKDRNKKKNIMSRRFLRI